MIKKFEEFINEDYFSKLSARKDAAGIGVRKEQNVNHIVLSDGTRINLAEEVVTSEFMQEVLKGGCEITDMVTTTIDDTHNKVNLIELDDDNYWYYLCAKDDDTWTVLGRISQELSGGIFDDEDVHDVVCAYFAADSNQDGRMTPFDLAEENKNGSDCAGWRFFGYGEDLEFDDNGVRYEVLVFDGEETATKYAVEECKMDIDDNMSIWFERNDYGSDKRSTFERWYDMWGDEIVDKGWFESAAEEECQYRVDDLYDSGEGAVIDELINLGLVEETEEYFGTDNDGDLDEAQPLFDVDDYRDQILQKYNEDIEDPIQYYIDNFGENEMGKIVQDNNLIDIDTLAEKIVDEDGPANTLSRYDGKEMYAEINGKDFYAYCVDKN